MSKESLIRNLLIFAGAIGLFVIAIINVTTSSDEIVETKPNSIKIAHYEYNGHSYIAFINEYDNRAGISHDPDCPKCKGLKNYK